MAAGNETVEKNEKVIHLVVRAFNEGIERLKVSDNKKKGGLFLHRLSGSNIYPSDMCKNRISDVNLTAKSWSPMEKEKKPRVIVTISNDTYVLRLHSFFFFFFFLPSSFFLFCDFWQTKYACIVTLSINTWTKA